jgi:hypothetical protein
MRDPNSELKKLEDENLYRVVRYGTEETGTSFSLNGKKLIIASKVQRKELSILLELVQVLQG